MLIQPYMASLEMLFYPLRTDSAGRGYIFPKEFDGGIFAAEHGSWNRANRSGYEVIFIPTQNGHATGEYDGFLTGFVTKDGGVWGRPVGVAVGKDGSLFVVDGCLQPLRRDFDGEYPATHHGDGGDSVQH